MSQQQGYELIGIAWLAMAAFDTPHDAGTLIYVGLSVWAFARAFRSTQ